jgi:hypothetical protein
MKRKPKPIQPASEQHRRFIEIARQLGADEDKERFEAKLRRIAKVKPVPGSRREKIEHE